MTTAEYIGKKYDFIMFLCIFYIDDIWGTVIYTVVKRSEPTVQQTKVNMLTYTGTLCSTHFSRDSVRIFG